MEFWLFLLTDSPTLKKRLGAGLAIHSAPFSEARSRNVRPYLETSFQSALGDNAGSRRVPSSKHGQNRPPLAIRAKLKSVVGIVGQAVADLRTVNRRGLWYGKGKAILPK